MQEMYDRLRRQDETIQSLLDRENDRSSRDGDREIRHLRDEIERLTSLTSALSNRLRDAEITIDRLNHRGFNGRSSSSTHSSSDKNEMDHRLMNVEDINMSNERRVDSLIDRQANMERTWHEVQEELAHQRKLVVHLKRSIGDWDDVRDEVAPRDWVVGLYNHLVDDVNRVTKTQTRRLKDLGADVADALVIHPTVASTVRILARPKEPRHRPVTGTRTRSGDTVVEVALGGRNNPNAKSVVATLGEPNLLYGDDGKAYYGRASPRYSIRKANNGYNGWTGREL